MTGQLSIFQATSSVFENARVCRITEHQLEQPHIARLMRASSALFQILDRTDAVQAEISRQLWLLRSSVLFTLLPFSEPALRLVQCAQELARASVGLPDALRFIESLLDAITAIVDEAQNPKGTWLLDAVAAAGSTERIGVLSALSMGRAPGWPPERTEQLFAEDSRVVILRSRRELRANVFDRMVLPCGCSNAPSPLLSEIIYGGRTATVDVLLYAGERFRVPMALSLPDDGVLSGRKHKTTIERAVNDMSRDLPAPAIDTWIRESFWQSLHGGARADSPDLCAANFVLFCDGTGTFVPRDGRVPTLPADGVLSHENDLRFVPVPDVCEGDFIIIRAGQSGILLDEAMDRVMDESQYARLFARATHWKGALEALLITHSCDEVAALLDERGVSVNAGNIGQWAGPDVLGPRDEGVFKALVALLAEKGKLPQADQIAYANSRWQSLQEVRSIRQRAGAVVRKELFTALCARLGNAGRELGDRESIHLSASSNAELLVLRVSCVDLSPAYVPPSRLGRLDDLKENKWLG